MKTNTSKKPAATKITLRPIGLDVHKDTIAVAVAEEGCEPYFLKTIRPGKIRLIFAYGNWNRLVQPTKGRQTAGGSPEGE